MKSLKIYFLLLAVAVSSTAFNLNAQEEEKESPFSVGADVVSGYVWRGTKVHGASIQPFLSYATGGFEVGAWGAYEISGISGVPSEADLYLSYGFDFGLSLGLTDYYYPGGEGYFEFSDSIGTHAIEINGGYEIGSFSIGANYILNKAGWAASEGSDVYFELGYSFTNLDVFVGAGNGWHSTFEDNGDDVFAICNIGVATSKEVKITDSFSLPVFGSVSLNPDRKQFNIVAGISF